MSNKFSGRTTNINMAAKDSVLRETERRRNSMKTVQTLSMTAARTADDGIPTKTT